MTFVLIMLACSDSEETDSGKGDSGLPANPPENVCTSGEEIVLDSTYPADGNTFEWDVDMGFIMDGGSFSSEDEPKITITCPPCKKPPEDADYAFMVYVESETAAELVYESIHLECVE